MTAQYEKVPDWVVLPGAGQGAPRGPGTYATSFDSSEGYTLGNLNGQNSWTTQTGGGGATTAWQVANTHPCDGDQHASSQRDTAAAQGPNPGDIGAIAISPSFAPQTAGFAAMEVDVEISATGGADYGVGTLDNTGAYTSRVLFRWNDYLGSNGIAGNLLFLGYDGSAYSWHIGTPETEFTPGQCGTLRIELDNTANQTRYYWNGSLLYTTVIFPTPNPGVIENVYFSDDQFQGGETNSFDKLSVGSAGATGSCCNIATGACAANVSAGDCSGMNEVFTINGDCANCSIAIGACCTAGRVCTDNVSLGDCDAQGGTFFGDGSTCANSPCPLECADVGSGQISDGNGYGAQGTLASVSNRTRPLAQAENFVPSVTGQITHVRWWGLYVDLAAGTVCSDGAVPDDFQITYYVSNSDGTTEFPGTIVGGPYSVAVTKLNTGYGGFGGIYQYDADHPPVDVQAGYCYWVEITNTDDGVCEWLWFTAPPGDGISASGTPGGPYDAASIDNDFDFGFCVDIDINTDGCLSSTPIPGACCLFQANACVDSDSDACGQLGGTFIGPLTTCSDPGAADYCSGACCDLSGNCQFVSEFACQNLSGFFHGIGVSCTDPDPCSQYACCDANGSCSPQDLAGCNGIGGAWLPGQTCADADCATPIGLGLVPMMNCNDSFNTNNSVVATSAQVFSCSGVAGAGDFWVSFQATDDSALISLANSSVSDTIVEVFEGPDEFTLTAVPNGCIDDTADSLNPEICIPTTAGNLYWIHAASFDNMPAELGPITIDVTCPCPATCDTCPGDLNGDTILDGGDIQEFTRCLIGAEGNSTLCVCADMNNDDINDINDVAPFVAAILNGGYCTGFPLQSCEPGSNGQLPDLQNSLTSSSTAMSQMIADNFDTTGGTITSIEWWGDYTDNCPDITDNFTVTIFNDDNNGAPGSVVTTLNNQVPVRTATGRVFDFGANGTPDEYRYTLSGLNIPLNAGCYWLAITNANTPSGCTWSWETSADGDSIIGVHFDSGPAGFQRFSGFDVAWCLDINIGDNSTCLVPMGACCSSGTCIGNMTQADCTTAGGTWFEGEDCNAGFQCSAFCGINGFCQLPSPAHLYTSDRDNDQVIGADLKILAGSGTINGICWWGSYFDANAGDCGDTTTDNWQIDFYNDDGTGVPMTPPFATLTTGGGLVVTRSDTGIEDVAGVRRFEFTTDLTGLGGVAVGSCVHIAISNGGDPACTFGWTDSTSEGNNFVDVFDGSGNFLGFAQGDQAICLDVMIDNTSAPGCP